jgi:hypothetical protein
MPTIPEIKAQLKELKKKHKEIRLTGLNKSEMLLLLSKYTNTAPPEKVVKAVKEKKERNMRALETKKKTVEELKVKRQSKVENLAHNLDVVLKVNKIRKFANVVKEKLEAPKRAKKILEEVETEVRSKHTRAKKLQTLQKLLAQMISGKRIGKFVDKVKDKIVAKRDYSDLSFV